MFDGHGGTDAAAYMKRHAIRFLFEDGDFPQWSEADNLYMESVESSVRRAFLQADQALSDEASVSRSSGTTALTALVLGRSVHFFFFASPDSQPPLTCLLALYVDFADTACKTMQGSVGGKCRGLPCCSLPKRYRS